MNYKVVRLASPGEVKTCACGGGCKGSESICGKYVKETIANGMVYESGKACTTVRCILEKAKDGFEEGGYYTILNNNSGLMPYGFVYHFTEGESQLLTREAYLTRMSTAINLVRAGGRR